VRCIRLRRWTRVATCVDGEPVDRPGEEGGFLSLARGGFLGLDAATALEGLETIVGEPQGAGST
jgi:hypothetical protein